MAGDQDMIPVAHTVEIWAAIPGAQLCIMPGASHFWMQEIPDLANRIVLDFLVKSEG
jgi:pimeloyl-ACP methyl ester carboxylesterase